MTITIDIVTLIDTPYVAVRLSRAIGAQKCNERMDLPWPSSPIRFDPFLTPIPRRGWHEGEGRGTGGEFPSAPPLQNIN